MKILVTGANGQLGNELRVVTYWTDSLRRCISNLMNR